MPCISLATKSHKHNILNYQDRDVESSYKTVTTQEYWRKPKLPPDLRVFKRLLIQEAHRRGLV